jgi:mannose-6-phosphate isomerase-like protein (cupin superfamily)
MTRRLLALAGLAFAVQIPSHASPAANVTYIPSTTVSAAFAKGMPLLETADYKIHASRREAPGVVEVHVRDTDIIYVLEGEATLVTGGEILEARTIARDEIRGTSVRGGETRRLRKGDVLVVPAGVPHWFTEVQPPLLYYVVKATEAQGGAR